MVTLSEDEKEPVERGPLKRVLIPCLISYIGYGLLGGWCLAVEIQHETEFEERKTRHPEQIGFHEKGPILELRAAVGLLTFSAVRILSLLIFVRERESTADQLSTIWLSFSTFCMMVAFFTAMLNLEVFFLIHPTFVTLFFILIAIDFVANVSVLIRNSPLY